MSNIGTEFRNPWQRSAGLRIRVIDVRPPERREVPAEVQLAVQSAWAFANFASLPSGLNTS
jgi:hypothetical protein